MPVVVEAPDKLFGDGWGIFRGVGLEPVLPIAEVSKLTPLVFAGPSLRIPNKVS